MDIFARAEKDMAPQVSQPGLGWPHRALEVAAGIIN